MVSIKGHEVSNHAISSSPLSSCPSLASNYPPTYSPTLSLYIAPCVWKTKVLHQYKNRYNSMYVYLNPLTPNDHYRGRTAPLTYKHIYSTNTSTEYFKHGIYSPLFSLQNAVGFIILTYLVSVLFTFYIQHVLKF